MTARPIGLCGALALSTLAIAAPAANTVQATSPDITQIDLLGPAGSERFGEDGFVLVLSNGNFVVGDPGFDVGGAIDAGAVHLYDGASNTRISTLTGSTTNDAIGSDGLVEVGEAQVAVVSSLWDIPGGAIDVGAVTVFDGAMGLDGTVSTTNSLHGTTASDLVGAGGVVPLTNGNYVVNSQFWNGAATDVGAVTWIDGNTGLTGPVTTGNSLHGTTIFDRVGFPGTTALSDGAYVVASRDWDTDEVDVGAATWADGTTGLTGAVTTANSLHGTTSFDQVGRGGAAALTNGNYVVVSPAWNGTASNAGAATWADGTTGRSGPVTEANSLHGTAIDDGIGSSGAVALANGNYVVVSEMWNGPDSDVGAATWADGTSGLSGPVTMANSLHGEAASDRVGNGGVAALTNGNYVVASPSWDAGQPPAGVGAATWADGTTGLSGPVSTSNSLHGTQVSDLVSSAGVWPLANGNYVVASRSWDLGGTVNVGAVTLAPGGVALTGPVTASSSLHGTSSGDQVGGGAITPLSNGDFVVTSNDWDDGATTNVGAVTRIDGTAGLTGPVTTDNSLHGTQTADGVGLDGNDTATVALPDGDYAVPSGLWDNGGTADAGAVSFGPAAATLTGPITASTSVIGTPPGEVSAPSGLLTADDAVAVPTSQNRVLLMQLDRAPFFPGSAPADVSAVSDSPDGATVTFPTPLADDVRSTPSVACAPASGSQFSPGDTEVTCTATDSIGQTAITSFTVSVVQDVTAVVPERILETRTGPEHTTIDGLFQGDGQLTGGQTLELQVAGRGGIPTDATAAFLNITAIRPDTRGFLTVFPCGTDLPNTSNVNYGPNDIAPNAVLAKIGDDGKVCIFTTITTHLITDTNGYIPAGGTTTPVNPERILETRTGPEHTTIDGLFQGDGQLTGGQTLELQVAGRGGIPTDATAAFLNITAIRPDTRGFLTVFPCGTDLPNTSNVNYGPNDIAPNAVLAKIGDDGKVCIFTTITTHLITDTNGYIPAGGTTTPVNPERILETRTGPEHTTTDGLFQGDGQLTGGQTLELQVAGRGGIPTDATAAFLNITAIRPDTRGFLTVFPCGTDLPNTSNVNYGPNDIAPNAVLAKIGDDGKVCIFTTITTHLITDTNAYVPG